MLFRSGMAVGVYPLANFSAMAIITHNYIAWIAVFSMLILTLTGWDRFIPLLKIPREPNVKLVKKNVSK